MNIIIAIIRHITYYVSLSTIYDTYNTYNTYDMCTL